MNWQTQHGCGPAHAFGTQQKQKRGVVSCNKEAQNATLKRGTHEAASCQPAFAASAGHATRVRAERVGPPAFIRAGNEFSRKRTRSNKKRSATVNAGLCILLS